MPCLTDPLAAGHEQRPIYAFIWDQVGILPWDIYHQRAIQENAKQFCGFPFLEDKIFFQTIPITAHFFIGLPPAAGRCWIWYPKFPRYTPFCVYHKWTPNKTLLDESFLLRSLSAIALEDERKPLLPVCHRGVTTAAILPGVELLPMQCDAHFRKESWGIS